MSRKTKVHMVEPSRALYNGREPAWMTVCSLFAEERALGDRSTRDPARATCWYCLRVLKKRGDEASGEANMQRIKAERDKADLWCRKIGRMEKDAKGDPAAMRKVHEEACALARWLALPQGDRPL